MARMPTAQWVASVMRDADDVTGIEALPNDIIRVTRKDHEPFNAGIISVPRVEVAHVQPFLDPELDVEIIINVPPESVWTGDAICAAKDGDIATGNMGDLRRVMHEENVRSFQRAEFKFIDRGLRQHSRVSDFRLEFDRVYLIERFDLRDLRVAVVNAYEMTADHVRTAWDRYGPFDLILNNNPNGGQTSMALQAAAGIQIEVLKWADFYSRLNRD